jgi:hypothetical protein
VALTPAAVTQRAAADVGGGRATSLASRRRFCAIAASVKIPDHSAFSRTRNERFRNSDIFRRVFERVVEACIAAGLVGGEGFAVDASLIVADANKHRSIPGSEWQKTRDLETAKPRREGVPGNPR